MPNPCGVNPLLSAGISNSFLNSSKSSYLSAVNQVKRKTHNAATSVATEINEIKSFLCFITLFYQTACKKANFNA